MERRVLLVILDGWGMAPAGKGNAISRADTPNFDFYWTKFPHLKLHAHGESVGLPKGQMGNSEVGHLNIGGGRIVWQDLPRITKSIHDKSFFKNQVLKNAFSYARKFKKPVHLMGLVSDGGVHSHEEHLFALLTLAKKEKVGKVYVHVFTDGRDTPPSSALKYVKRLESKMRTLKIGRIATICGRYYAMDRDNRWDRTRLAYEAIVKGQGELATSPEKAIQASYRRNISDEFIKPVIIDEKGTVKEGDAIIFFNLRSDRPRQLTKALIEENFIDFHRALPPKKLYMVTMTEYEKGLPIEGVAFPQELVKNTLAETLSENGLRQFHIAETEKYAHVTYFFNGGNEKAFPKEERVLIPSPKVATYDRKPEMSAPEVTDNLLARIGMYDFIVVNYANLDMVGHTGNLRATIQAAEVVDKLLGKVVEKAKAEGYEVIITADHGNAEEMIESDGSPKTSHTTNPVPLILIDNKLSRFVDSPKLGNIAPTVLDIMNLDQPKEMTEKTLLTTRRAHV